MNKSKKPIFKKWWFWAIVIWLALGFATLIAACSFLANAAKDIVVEDIPTIPNVFGTDAVPGEEPTTIQATEPSIETTISSATHPTEAPTETPTEPVVNQFDKFVKKSLVELMARVDELGYTATYFNQGVDFTEILAFYTEEDCKSLLVVSIDEDPFAKTVVVNLLPGSFVENEDAENALRNKLEIGSAWNAVEDYGKDEFGEFELHYLTGKIAEYADDKDTWFLKAECTFYGIEMVCEAKVTGTTETPNVIEFEIY